jgi:hypothetical protein
MEVNMNEQFLQELRLYLQKHMEVITEAFITTKEDVSCNYQISDMEAPAQFVRPDIVVPKSDSNDRIKHKIQQNLMYNQNAAPSIQHATNRTSDKVHQETDIEEYIRKTRSEETFSTKLLKYIDRTGLPDSEVYKRAGIDRRHFSKIRCDKNYRPRKATAVALCLALELELSQVEELLELAGYSFSNSDTGDLIVKFCIKKGKYDLMDVNEALVYFGVKAIGAVG